MGWEVGWAVDQAEDRRWREAGMFGRAPATSPNKHIANKRRVNIIQRLARNDGGACACIAIALKDAQEDDERRCKGHVSD